MYDARQTKLEVGQAVAYNISGEVAKGRILRLVQPVDEPSGYGWNRRTKKALIEIELLHNAAGHRVGHVSKVRHENSVLVLKEGEA